MLLVLTAACGGAKPHAATNDTPPPAPGDAPYDPHTCESNTSRKYDASLIMELGMGKPMNVAVEFAKPVSSEDLAARGLAAYTDTMAGMHQATREQVIAVCNDPNVTRMELQHEPTLNSSRGA